MHVILAGDNSMLYIWENFNSSMSRNNDENERGSCEKYVKKQCIGVIDLPVKVQYIFTAFSFNFFLIILIAI